MSSSPCLFECFFVIGSAFLHSVTFWQLSESLNEVLYDALQIEETATHTCIHVITFLCNM